MSSNRFLELSIFRPEDWSPHDTGDVISWHGHIPFAFTLIRLLKPACLVELGTHRGDSYFAFCEAVSRYSSETRCFAVDTWKGDPHAGYYGQEVFAELRDRHDRLYKDFSNLMPSTFDDALSKFSDGSVDLLHIDGLHTYPAVRHDFENWKSKMSDRGIVLLHDINVHEADFGVWKLWEELCPAYPAFAFHHSNGLGVLAVGKEAAGSLPDLFGVDSETADRIRALYATLGHSIAFHGLDRALRTFRLESERAAEKAAFEMGRLSAECERAGTQIRRLNASIDLRTRKSERGKPAPQ